MRIFKFFAIAVAVVRCSYAFPSKAESLHGRNLDSTDPESIWKTIQASKSLEWHECYPGQGIQFQCARLLVPLNYAQAVSSKNSAAIALVRTPSTHPPSSSKYKGPILFNPGGPGGSGVDIILFAGQYMRQILGDSFDLVGFDPRGISRSTPTVSFFNNTHDRDVWNSRISTYGVINASTNSLAEYVASSQVIGKLAVEQNTDDYLNFINTDHTARDMLCIVKAYGMDKLQYWGFSYGSILGATFATLFPDNVGRVIIDGVVDAYDFYANLWSHSLLDTDKTLQVFFDSCYKAGPSHCSFYAPSPQAISQNLDKLYESLKNEPLPVYSRKTGSYGVVDHDLLRTVVFKTLYTPYSQFPALADGLKALSTGDAETLWDIAKANPFVEASVASDAEIAIECNDGDAIPGTVHDAQQYYAYLSERSPWADVWAGNRIGCSGWPNLGKYFRGPFVANTSHPILLIGNTADPVTPIAGAMKMSKGFPGSVVLTQDSAGHCSFTAPSTCTVKHVKAYFETGVLPAEGTVCPVLAPPIPAIPGRLIPKRSVPTGEEPDLDLRDDEDSRALVDAVWGWSKLQPLRKLF